MKKGKQNPKKKKSKKIEKDSNPKSNTSQKGGTKGTSKRSKMEFENVTEKMLGRISISFIPPGRG